MLWLISEAGIFYTHRAFEHHRRYLHCFPPWCSWSYGTLGLKLLLNFATPPGIKSPTNHRETQFDKHWSPMTDIPSKKNQKERTDGLLSMNFLKLGDIPSNRCYLEGHVHSATFQTIVSVPSCSFINFRNVLISQEINTPATELPI